VLPQVHCLGESAHLQAGLELVLQGRAGLTGVSWPACNWCTSVPAGVKSPVWRGDTLWHPHWLA